MIMLDRLSFGLIRKVPVILQTEVSECGLASICMVSGYHGYHVDLQGLRCRFQLSLKGANLQSLIKIADCINLTTRAVSLDIDDLDKLKLPCILHWNFNHFVVLTDVSANSVSIIDPACGHRKLSLTNVSKSFTGVALELWPNSNFKEVNETKPLKLRSLMGRVTGLFRSFSQIFLLSLVLEVFNLVNPFYLQWVIDNVLVSADQNLLTTLAIGFGLLMLIQQCVELFRGWILMYAGTSLNVQWQANVFAHLLKLPIGYFEKRHLGDLVSRFNTVGVIQQTLTTSFIAAILDGLMSVVTLVLMFVYSPTLAWIAVGAMVLYALSRFAWYAPLRASTAEQIIHSAKQQSHFLESMRGVKTIKLFNRQDERRSSWISLLVNQINANLRTQKLGLFYKFMNGALFGLENILIVWFGAKFVMSGNFTVGALIAFNSYKGQFDARVSSLIDKFFEVRMLQLQGERLADVVLTDPEQTSGNLLENDIQLTSTTIQVKNLRFKYSDQEPYVIDDISFDINDGESVAIVGPSGGGKTTLVNILLGILAPNKGEILIGGKSINRIPINSLRNMIGTVLQDDVLFAGSIIDNISFFAQPIDQQWVEQCAQLAAIHDDIVGMPMGYNTLVGDMGTVLSGGQKQRILLARALYKRPKILFLDEATSHLDIERERIVNKSIKSLNITRVIVAHRPETIRSADRIMSIINGKLHISISKGKGDENLATMDAPA
ncbi:peptidase domain-containing ABC transporter [Undibacterium sp. 14-3-2]|uniref:peptidase domain-containing ABC transporter n=1 Tax=Undibacterium sp. 14-3-2 TaxID=2800129 RepID=UPI001906E584|nr:peptidase domain-containing ABC transporter [Undibacterium sp. 14-3-2]